MPLSSDLNRRDVVLATIAGLLGLGLYLRTLFPGVLPGDSGEFQVLAYQVGMAHTTGYPIYMLLARLFILMAPVGDIAYRVNLFSAVMGALTIALVYLAGRILTGNRWAALLGALALAVSYTFWSQSLIAEVYTAGAAFQIAVVAALLLWYKTARPWALFLAGLSGGIGLGVHGSLSLLALAAGILLLLNRSRWKASWKPALAGALAGLCLFVVGFVLVDWHAPPANIWNAAYGPSRSAWNLTETDVRDPLVRFWFIVSAAQWRSAMFVNPLVDTPVNLGEYLFELPRELSLLTIALAVLGWVALLRDDKKLAVFFSAALVLYWVYGFNYRVGDRYVFHISSYVLLALLAAAGLASAIQWVERLRWRGAGLLRVALPAVVLAGSLIPMLAPHVEAIQAGRTPFINAEDYLVDDMAATVPKIAGNTVPFFAENAIVFTDWTWLYPYYYAAHIEQQRLDLQFVETFSRSDQPGLPASIIELIQAEIGLRPIYFSERVAEVERAGFELKPVYFGFIRFYKVQSVTASP